jgi:oxygen-independent coproporphyrinogen-3 oxidase
MIDHPTRDVGFGLYVHWPFCASKCPYCDFNSHVRRAPVDEPRFVAAFLREMRHVAGLTRGRTVSSVFFGGGTPSLMSPGAASAILDGIAALWPVDPKAEITLEANPSSVEAERFRGYRSACPSACRR